MFLSAAPRLGAGTGQTAAVYPVRLRNRHAKGSNPQHGSICGGCAVRTKEKSSNAALSPMFPDNKAVQPCLARQADIRRAISFASPAALAKFAKQKKPT